MKKLRWLAAAGLMALAFAAPQVAQADDSCAPYLAINERYIDMDDSTGRVYINEDNRAMIPLRLVNNELGMETQWRPYGTVTVSGGASDKKVEMTIGHKDVTIDGKETTFGTAPVLKNNRVYLPARDLMQLYGVVAWDYDRVVIFTDTKDPYYYVTYDKGLWRITDDKIDTVALPEGMEVTRFYHKPDTVSRHAKVIDGKRYLTIYYDQNLSGVAQLFRDDGDHLTHLIRLCHTTDFTVDGNKIYHTMGTDAGSETSFIKPNRLLVDTLNDDGSRTQRAYDLDFAVNDASLSIQDHKLLVTTPDGSEHIVDVSTMTPDAEYNEE
ncbi:MAG: copper amine oxidase N-terminal domain-containing protein [Peptococcaceae bacterium]|nr:copper amine oxidase N-terminal domain-containing protein [Peptococcaceae bacterium]